MEHFLVAWQMMSPSPSQTVASAVDANTEYFQLSDPFNCTDPQTQQLANCIEATTTVIWPLTGWDLYETTAEELGISYMTEITPARLQEALAVSGLFPGGYSSKIDYRMSVLHPTVHNTGRAWRINFGIEMADPLSLLTMNTEQITVLRDHILNLVDSYGAGGNLLTSTVASVGYDYRRETERCSLPSTYGCVFFSAMLTYPTLEFDRCALKLLKPDRPRTRTRPRADWDLGYNRWDDFGCALFAVTTDTPWPLVSRGTLSMAPNSEKTLQPIPRSVVPPASSFFRAPMQSRWTPT